MKCGRIKRRGGIGLEKPLLRARFFVPNFFGDIDFPRNFPGTSGENDFSKLFLRKNSKISPTFFRGPFSAEFSSKNVQKIGHFFHRLMSQLPTVNKTMHNLFAVIV
jgi:hypothetical protein